MSSNSHAIWYLQRRIIFNWFRRSMRSPFFWIIAAFLLFAFGSQIASIFWGPDADPPDFLEDRYLVAAASISLTVAIVIGLWRGGGATPKASLADVVVMFGSPTPPRLHYAVLAAKPSAINALVIGVWATAGASGLVFTMGDSWFGARVLFSVMTVVLMAEFLRFSIWVWTEQTVARSGTAGRQLRRAMRGAALLVGIVAGAIVFEPVVMGEQDTWLTALDSIVERGEYLAMIPPMAFLAGVLVPGGLSILHFIAMTGVMIGVVAFGLYHARDFAEPIAVSAEHHTDPRGQMMEAGADVQWAALSQYGVSPGMGFSLPMFGSGPWALLWGSLVRWLRYQFSAAWITLLSLGFVGLAAALGVRFGLITIELAWGIVLMFPFLGSINMFMDELRRQFIFMVPGSNWARLTAGAITSVLDGFLSGVLMTVILLVVNVIPLSEAAGLTLLCAAIALLAQASLAMVQILLPWWIGQKVRVGVTLGLTGIAMFPALGVMITFHLAGSAALGMVIAAGIVFVIAAIMTLLAGVLFDRAEFSG